ncbi:MAG: hypothetical protein ACOYOB_20015, partial [Myxococcota bacterium]
GEIPAALALATFELTAAARELNAEPLLVLSAPLWSDRVLETARAFVERHVPDFGWAIATDDGGLVIRLPKFKIDHVQRPVVRTARAPSPRQATDLFTDANRWMLKILLLRQASADLWGGPRVEVRGVLQLSRTAGVTPESTYRFVRALRAQGFAEVERGAFRLVRRAVLVGHWLAHDAAQPLPWQPVRWRRGRPQQVEDVFADPVGGSRYAVTGFEACKSLGVLHASTPGVQVLLECGLDEAMRTWKLEPAAPSDAHFWIARARYPLSTFGGVVMRGPRTVVDAMQAALDVRSNPVRGVEQSDYIVREVLQLLEGP